MRKLKYSDFAHRIDIDALEEAIGFEALETVNGEDRGYCPLPWNMHKSGDTTGKFSINREKHVYNCWVCDGGSLLSLAMAMQSMDPEAATTWLYQFVLSEDASNDALDEIDRRFGGRKERRVAPYFNQRVLDSLDATHPWFLERNIDTSIAKFFGAGYDAMATKWGRDEQYTGPAVVLPHWYDGRLVGWQHRWLDDERPKWVAKYTNTPDFPREWTLWGYDACVENACVPVVVESVPTAMRLWSLGQPSLATFGSNLNPDQLLLLRGFLSGVVAAPDNDKPGVKWLGKIQEYLDRYVPVYVCEAVGENGNDLGDISEAETLAALKRVEVS